MTEIIWQGHAMFRLRGKDATIITDPYDRSLGLELPRPKADIVTISHDHPHHNAVSTLKGEPRVLRSPGEYEIKGVFITGVGAFADNKKGAERGSNVIYLIEMDDLIICHLGSLGHTLSAKQVELLSDVHVLLVPVGGHTTLDAAKAVEVIGQIEPRVVVPMHYRTGPEQVGGEDSLEKFAREMGLKEWTPQDRLNVKASDLPETTSVVVLDLKQ
jgi:L-ascorbate metabolism protein UlaG (beta-lactamase superfamily)